MTTTLAWQLSCSRIRSCGVAIASPSTGTTPGASTPADHHLGREVVDVSVRFAARIPVRPVRLIAEGCGLSRAEVERLITEGKLVSAVRLSGKLSDDFTFTLKR